MKMTLSLCCDDKFVMPTLVCLISVFENNKNVYFDVYIITAGLSNENNKRFQMLSELYSQNIMIKVVDNDLFSSFNIRGRYPFATYYRFLIADLIPDNKVLYLDGDIVVMSSLEDLWNTNLDGFACAAVEDSICHDLRMINRLKLSSTYFNAGVLLINLEYWRENEIGKMLFDFTENNKSICYYLDQDAMNVVLSNKICYLPLTFNFQHNWCVGENKTPLHFSKWSEFSACKDNPVIIHYNITEKPWFRECPSFYRDKWLVYANMHDFVGYKQARCYKKMYLYCNKLINKLNLVVYKIGIIRDRYWR